MRVLLTNDDGIQATGLNDAAPGPAEGARDRAGRDRARFQPLGERPQHHHAAALWAEEIEFEDGTKGYATDGTPVDCVRFASLGLIGEPPS